MPSEGDKLSSTPASVESYSKYGIVAQAFQRASVDTLKAGYDRLRIKRLRSRVRLDRAFLDALNGVREVKIVDLLQERIGLELLCG